jgi:hypothetical protein
MTRCLHAQLEQQGSAFAPPQHLANAWKTHLAQGGEHLNSKLSPSTASAWPEESELQLEETSVDVISFERGLRLTSAFEMLYQVKYLDECIILPKLLIFLCAFRRAEDLQKKLWTLRKFRLFQTTQPCCDSHWVTFPQRLTRSLQLATP